MKEQISIDRLYYSTEKNIPVIGGALYEGYKMMLNNDVKQGEKIITDFLVAVYDTPERRHEQSTKRFVDKIRNKIGLAINNDRSKEIVDIVRQATEEQFEKVLHPLFLSIRTRGFLIDKDTPITIRKENGKLLLVDGKNRISILAAMGYKNLPENWEWD